MDSGLESGGREVELVGEGERFVIVLTEGGRGENCVSCGDLVYCKVRGWRWCGFALFVWMVEEKGAMVGFLEYWSRI